MSEDEYFWQDEAASSGAASHGAGSTRAVQIPSGRHVLQGTLCSVPDPRLLVVIHAATGVPAGFYLPFARWLSAQYRAMVLTYDYRGSGASGRPHRSDATMTDWGLHDATAARHWLVGQAPDLPLWVIGHSLGGMAMAFQPDTARIDRIITVAAGHGHVSDHPWPFQGFAWLLWYLVGPISTVLLGYLPGRRLGLGSNLPKGVFWQWRRWLLDRKSLPNDPALGGINRPGYTGPITLIALRDDVMMPPGAVWKMADWHPDAGIEQRLIDPADFGLRKIGHIHAFASRNAALWPRIVAPYAMS